MKIQATYNNYNSDISAANLTVHSTDTDVARTMQLAIAPEIVSLIPANVISLTITNTAGNAATTLNYDEINDFIDILKEFAIKIKP